MIHSGSTYSSSAQSVENYFEDEEAHKLAEEHEAGLNEWMIERPCYSSVATNRFDFISPSEIVCHLLLRSSIKLVFSTLRLFLLGCECVQRARDDQQHCQKYLKSTPRHCCLKRYNKMTFKKFQLSLSSSVFVSVWFSGCKRAAMPFDSYFDEFPTSTVLPLKNQRLHKLAGVFVKTTIILFTN